MNPSLIMSNVSEKNFNLVHLNLTSGNLSYENINLRNIMNLKIIDLSRNNFQIFSSNLLNNKQGLHYLNLNWNFLTEISIETFEDLHNLFYLKLSFNKILILKKNSFSFLKKLFILELSGNNIKTIEADIFPVLNIVENLTIDIEITNFHEINSNVFENLNRLKYFEPTQRVFCYYIKNSLNECKWKKELRNFKRDTKFFLFLKVLLMGISNFAIFITTLNLSYYFYLDNFIFKIEIFQIFQIVNDFFLTFHLALIFLTIDFEKGNFWNYITFFIKSNICQISHFTLNLRISLQISMNIFCVFWSYKTKDKTSRKMTKLWSTLQFIGLALTFTIPILLSVFFYFQFQVRNLKIKILSFKIIFLQANPKNFIFECSSFLLTIREHSTLFIKLNLIIFNLIFHLFQLFFVLILHFFKLKYFPFKQIMIFHSSIYLINFISSQIFGNTYF